MHYYLLALSTVTGICFAFGILFLFAGLRRKDNSGSTVLFSLFALSYGVVILLRPPLRRPSLVGMGNGERSGDWRPTAVVLVLLVLVFVAAWVPLADDLVGLKPLQQAGDYAVVGLAVLAWASAAVFFWRVRPLERLMTFLQKPRQSDQRPLNSNHIRGRMG